MSYFLAQDGVFRSRILPILIGIGIGGALVVGSVVSRIDYRNYLRQTVDGLIGYHVAYEDTSFIFFPTPAIQLNSVRVYPNFVIPEPIARADKLVFSLSWKTLFQRSLVLNRIALYRAVVRLVRYPDGRIDFYGINRGPVPIKVISGSEVNITSKIAMSILQIGGFVVHDSRVFFKDEASGKIHRFRINYGSLDYQQTARSFNLESRGELDGKRLDLNLSANLPEGEIGFESMYLKGRLEFESLPMSFFQRYMNRFYLADYSGARVNGFVNFSRNPASPYEGNARVTVIGLQLKKGIRFSPFTGTFNYRFSGTERFLQFPTINIGWPETAYLYGNGWLNWTHALNMHFNIHATEGNYHSIIDLIQALRVKSKKPPPGVKVPGRRTFHLDLKKVFAYNHTFDTVVGDMAYENWILNLKDFRMGIYGGYILGDGNINYLKQTFHYNGQAENLNVPNLIGPESITGSLYASMNMNTSIVSGPDFFSKMRARGRIIIKNGELIGYANIMRPVALIGKFMNVTGPSGKSTGFTSITSRYVIRSSRVYISNLDMVGVGLDAKASGSIGFDKTIDMKVTLGMGGDLWKHVLKIPIIYDGEINKDYPYVDPIWLTAVAVGGGFLVIVPPYNPIQGAVVGSLVSDWIRDAYEGVKGWFSDDEEARFKQELEEEFENAPDFKSYENGMMKKPEKSNEPAE